LKVSCQEKDVLKKELEKALAKIAHLEFLVEKGTELFQTVNLKSLKLSEEMSRIKLELDQTNTEVIQKNTNVAIMKYEAQNLKEALEVLLKASADFKNIKHVTDKHSTQILKNEEKYQKQKAEFDDLKG
jgi:ribosomal protein L16 Arg81 hydroxylase